MDIQCSLLLMMTRDNQYVLVLTYRYYILKRAILTSLTFKMTSARVPTVFRNHWIVPVVIIAYLLTGNKSQLFFKCFGFIRAYLGPIHFIATAHHSQTNGQPEWYIRATGSQLGHYGTDLQKNWDLFISPSACKNSTQVQRKTGTHSYSLGLSHH